MSGRGDIMGNIVLKRYSYWLLVPGALVYFVFFILPSMQSVFYSFTYWDVFSARFAGFDNYKNILTDTNLNLSLKNTLIFTAVTSFFKVGLGMLLALFLNRGLKTENFLRTVYFSPCIINNIAVGLMFAAMFHPRTGIVNRSLYLLNLDALAQHWLTDRTIAIYSVAFIEIWKWTGFTMIILLAGLQMITKDYYEAASIDGASDFQKFRVITLPLIMPAVTNAVIINLIGGLKVFDIIYATTQGGPGSATEVMNSFVYKAFGQGRYGEACAASVLLALMVSVIVVLSYTALTRREVEM